MTERENDRLAEHIHQLEAENNQLTGKLKAANREIERMHKQVLLAKAAAKEAAENVGAMSAALYIGATLRYGIPTHPGRHDGGLLPVHRPGACKTVPHDHGAGR